MKNKIFMLFLALGMTAMQVDAQGLFKKLKQSVKDAKQTKTEVSTGSQGNADSSSTASSSNDEVTLVVSADGATKDEATKVALRSAIEQAYGTFVSANTTILNDELVKDEIVTVASGNIKNYQEISSNVMSDGKTFVTLQATVCISKLVSYAQSKGAEAEFAGATFGMQMRLKEMYKNNEIKALHNMYEQLSLIPNLFDYEIKLGEPSEISRAGGNFKEDAKNYYYVWGRIYLIYNANTQLYNDIVFNTLKSLSENQYLEKVDNYYKASVGVECLPKPTGTSAMVGFRLRSDASWCSVVYPKGPSGNGNQNSIMQSSANKFMISDNLSSPTNLEFITGEQPSFEASNFEYNSSVMDKSIQDYWADPFTYYYSVSKIKQCRKIGDIVGVVGFELKIPKEDIGKYTNFKVERKN